MESDKFLDRRCKAPQEKQTRKIPENIKKKTGGNTICDPKMQVQKAFDTAGIQLLIFSYCSWRQFMTEHASPILASWNKMENIWAPVDQTNQEPLWEKRCCDM